VKSQEISISLLGVLLLSQAAPAAAGGEVSDMCRGLLDQPFVALFDVSDGRCSRQELRSLQAAIRKDRDEALDASKRIQESFRRRLEAARDELRRLNASSSTDAEPIAARRAALHREISELEASMRSQDELDRVIPAAFEIKSAKLYLIERWPGRRAEIIRRIEAGAARRRTHGDVDDVGYRKLVKDPQEDSGMALDLVRQMTLDGTMPAELQNAAVQQYVRRLAGRIAENSDLRRPLRTTVLDSPEAHAIGLPGGLLFVTSGMILATETESELAGVISREIARIAAQHALRSARRPLLSKILGPAVSVAAGIFSAGVGNMGAYYGINYGAQGLSAIADHAFVRSRKQYQKEADQLGIQYAWKAGFDPKGFIAFLDSGTRQKPPRIPAAVLQSNPPLRSRLLDAFSEIRYLPARSNYGFNPADFQKAKSALTTR